MKIKIYLIATALTMFLISNFLFAQKIDTKHLSLHLRFNWEKRQAFGVAEISLLTTTATNKVYLDAGKLDIHSIFLNEKPLQYNYDGSDISQLEIVLDKMYPANEIIILKIDYHTNHENRADPNAIWGSFGKGLRFQQPTSTTPNKQKQIWSSGEPNNRDVTIQLIDNQSL